nr:immunoglobulin light chain junction region [Macaca mulatta]
CDSYRSGSTYIF